MFTKFLSDLYGQVIALKKQILIIAISIIASYSVYLWCSEACIIQIGLENNLFEIATVLFFLTASVLCLRVFFTTKSIFLLLLSIIFFIGAGEELSWGQQLFHFSTPDNIKKDNIQGEFNFHNLEVFNAGDEHHNSKKGWKRLLEINFMFRIFCISFGILLPLLVYFIPPLNNFCRKIKLPIPPLVIGLFFMANWFTFRTTLNALPEGKPDQPNATYLIANYNSNDSLTNLSTDAIIKQKIVTILKDSTHPEKTPIVKQFDVIKKGPSETHFEIKYIRLSKRNGVQSSVYHAALAAIPASMPEVKLEVSKDKDYYCTTTEAFECLSALILLFISYFFFKKKEQLFMEA